MRRSTYSQQCAMDSISSSRVTPSGGNALTYFGSTVTSPERTMHDLENLHPLAALRILQLIAPTGDIPPIDYPEPDQAMRCAIIAALLNRAELIVPSLKITSASQD